MALKRRGGGNGLEAWPGYVDALSTLLMVTIFVLLVFVLSEAFLSSALTGSDNTIAQLKNQIAALSESLSLQTAKNASLDQELASLNAQLASANAANAGLTQQLQSQAAASTGLQSQLAEQKNVSQSALNEVELLNQQIAAMRMQMAMLAQALDAAQAADAKDNVQIVDLGKQLNEALARKVEELQQYRSEFFGTLRQILANNPNIRIVGDRFVFQSDVLFPVDQATLTPAGQAEIADVAKAVKEIAAKIPPNVNWILSVDGYADSQAITGGPFKTNFDLSSARALTVLHLLVADGVPENRIAAAAMGSNNPISTGTGPADFAQNRRIEFRLTTP
jgi:chemotaxis protein MotB